MPYRKIFVLVLMFLFSCSKSPSYVDGDLVPPSPWPFTGFSGDGYDVDKDGLRDDVEIWINHSFEDANIRNATKIAAKDLIRMMNATTREEALILNEKMRLNHTCINFLSRLDVIEHPLNVDKYLLYRKKVRNTEERDNKFGNSLRLLPRGIYSVGAVNAHEFYFSCSFEVKNFKKIVKSLLENGNLTENYKQYARAILNK